MVNYVGRKFLPHLSTVLKPLNDLLRKDRVWMWESAQEKALQDVKKMISSAPVLAMYNPNLPTVVSADASSYGLGGVLLQDHGEDYELRPVAYCSRMMSSCEQSYAQIEKECLAITHACEKFNRYIHGLTGLTILTDHKPLVPLLNTKDVDLALIRCQRMLLRLLRYNYTAEHCPGVQMVISDLLSRQPGGPDLSERPEEDIEEVVECYADSLTSAVLEDLRLKSVKAEQAKDSTLKKVMDYTLNGWPPETDKKTEKFRGLQDSLSVVGELLCYGSRIVVPETMKEDVLDKIHHGHIGLNKCRRRAQDSVFWPRLNDDLKMKIAACKFCQEQRPRQRSEPLIPTEMPSGPWRKLAADLMEWKGKQYLVVVDYYSRYPVISTLSALSSASVINKLKAMFATHGLPCEVVTDGGSQFTSAAFAEFAKQCEFVHTATSPHFPQANGEAERAVRTAKHIIKQPESWSALLAYRAAPLHGLGVSPAELLMGRKLRTIIPALPLKKPIEEDKIRRDDMKMKAKMKANYDSRKGAKVLQDLKQGDHVRARVGDQKKWTGPLKVTGRHDASPRSYWITDGNSSWRRNRRHLLGPLPCPVDPVPDQVNPDDDHADSPVRARPHPLVSVRVTGPDDVAGRAPDVGDSNCEPATADAGGQPATADAGGQPATADAGGQLAAAEAGGEATPADAEDEPVAAESPGELEDARAGRESAAAQAGGRGAGDAARAGGGTAGGTTRAGGGTAGDDTRAGGRVAVLKTRCGRVVKPRKVLDL